MYSPALSKKEVEHHLSKLRKLNYNQFRWWRMYEPVNKPLCARKPLNQRILNGDFDYSHYAYQAMLCEYQLNELWEEHYPDIVKYNENCSVLRARRKRLWQDFEKDENQRLEDLIKGFTNNFKCNRETVLQEMEEYSGNLIDLYYLIEDKYKVQIKPYPGKSRPRKN